MTVIMKLDDDELIVDSERQFREVLNDFGANGMVWFEKKFIRDYVNSLYAKIERLETKKALGAQEIKRGKWISTSGYDKCSICGMLELGQTTYCPWCGAKMKGE